MIFRAPETLSREQAKQAKLDKKKNHERVKQIRVKLAAKQSITSEEEMLLTLSRDTYFDLFRNRNVMISCVLYAFVCMVQSAQDSLLPLYLINSVDKGGFDFDQTDIGWLYTGIGPIQIIFNHILCRQPCDLHPTSALPADGHPDVVSEHLSPHRSDLLCVFDSLPLHFTDEPYARVSAVGCRVDRYDVLYLLSFDQLHHLERTD